MVKKQGSRKPDVGYWTWHYQIARLAVARWPHYQGLEPEEQWEEQWEDWWDRKLTAPEVVEEIATRHGYRVGNPVPFGVRLRQAREDAGLTVDQLAEKSGLSRAALYHLEGGERSGPSFSTACKLADALGVGADALRPG